MSVAEPYRFDATATSLQSLLRCVRQVLARRDMRVTVAIGSLRRSPGRGGAAPDSVIQKPTAGDRPDAGDRVRYVRHSDRAHAPSRQRSLFHTISMSSSTSTPPYSV